MSPSVPLSALRPVWWGAALFPGLISLLPWFAPSFTGIWFLLIFYSAPAVELAKAAGLAADEHRFWVFPLASGLLIGLLFELAMRAAGKRRGAWRQIRWRTAMGVAVTAAALALGILGWRYAQWIDWPARYDPPEHALFDLRTHAEKYSELRVYEMPSGLIDFLYAGRLRLAPDALPDLVEALALEPLPQAEIDDAFWSAPAAWWWRPPRDGLFYGSPGFPITERGPDGDYYLFLNVPGDDVLWFWHRSNF